MTPDEFVRARLAEDTLPQRVSETFYELLHLADRIREDGNANDALSWITGAPLQKIGEYVFGADPASDGSRIRDGLLTRLASTWKTHPDFDPHWTGK